MQEKSYLHDARTLHLREALKRANQEIDLARVLANKTALLDDLTSLQELLAKMQRVHKEEFI